MYNSIEIIENGLLIESATFLEDARSKVCTSEPNKMSKNTFLDLDMKISFILWTLKKLMQVIHKLFYS
ncbi:hypothetical protein LamDB_27580 [Bacillus anthracis]|nr:hypothetical protein BAN44_0881 [Bacillus anthracis]GAO63640.1 hypothetical protein BA5240_0890 [Bacillus anthracis]GET97897.1 hypothetical protein DB1_12230 [Bacillus anthracis]GEU08869.1 hypothetical protein HG1_43540 [Bacillus anthracis]GEU13110.1 hypothetical protein QuyetLC_55040 [Bacillus anthracis]